MTVCRYGGGTCLIWRTNVRRSELLVPVSEYEGALRWARWCGGVRGQVPSGRSVGVVRRRRRCVLEE